MPEAARLGDKAYAMGDSHGSVLCCPHNVTGPIIMGAPSVLINGKPAVREQNEGIHAICCGPNTFRVWRGSETVFIEGYAAARKGDETYHCGYATGTIIEGSSDVFIGG